MSTLYTFKAIHANRELDPIVTAGATETEARERAVKIYANKLARALYGSLAIVHPCEIEDDRELGVVFADAGFYNEESEDFDSDIFDFKVELIPTQIWGGWA